MTLTIDDPRWEAVLARDARADGFVYSVATTGVYCRPACGARTPNRRNVAFHADAAAAEAAGFRPCKRCRPNEAPLAERQAALVATACRHIEQAEEALSLDELAAEYDGKVKIGKVNIDDHQNLALQFRINSIPTLLFFKNGQVVDQVVGLKSKRDFKAKLDQVGA